MMGHPTVHKLGSSYCRIAVACQRGSELKFILSHTSFSTGQYSTPSKPEIPFTNDSHCPCPSSLLPIVLAFCCTMQCAARHRSAHVPFSAWPHSIAPRFLHFKDTSHREVALCSIHTSQVFHLSQLSDYYYFFQGHNSDEGGALFQKVAIHICPYILNCSVLRQSLSEAYYGLARGKSEMCLYGGQAIRYKTF
jgi:hypothetical protein